MPHQRPEIDPDGLDEFSVVFTDRSLNHMSKRFQQVMRDLSAGLCEVYGAAQVAIVPGGGSYAMESVAHDLLKASLMSGTDRLVSWAVCAAIEYIWPSLVCALEAEPFEKRLRARISFFSVCNDFNHHRQRLKLCNR